MGIGREKQTWCLDASGSKHETLCFDAQERSIFTDAALERSYTVRMFIAQ